MSDNFLTKTMQTGKWQVCKAKAKNETDYVQWSWSWGQKDEMRREMAPVGLQEGAGGLSFTMVCVQHAQSPQG